MSISGITTMSALLRLIGIIPKEPVRAADTTGKFLARSDYTPIRGDRATHVMLDALEQVRNERDELRGRYTCYVELVRDDDLQRIVDLGVIRQATPY
jgi:hypothetical protein